MSQQDNSEICPQRRRGRLVWTGFANVENEPNPPFNVTEGEQFRQYDVCGHRDRSVSRQERVNIRQEVQAVLRRQDDNESTAATQEHLIIMIRNGRSGNE
jgi:hypothetical protein